MPIGVRVALRQLTIVPVAWDERENTMAPARSVPWFAAIGLAIGLVLTGVMLLPLPPVVRAALALTVWTVLSGGLHEDAVIDCADAAVPPLDQARRREILKDPHAGAHGVTALLLLLILRFAGLLEVPAAAALVTPVAGRWCMALTLAYGKPMQSGHGARFSEGAARVSPSLVALAILAGLTFFIDWRLTVAVLPGILAGGALGSVIAHRLGGFNGDVHGASGFVAETCTLLACAIVVS